MKKLSHKVSRVGDVVTVEAAWRTRMRVPAKVEIHKGKSEELSMGLQHVLLSGDAAEVNDILNGIAEIAWENGWRPAGLGATLEAIVKGFKIPKA